MHFENQPIETQAKIVLSIKGGDFLKFWTTLSPEGRKSYRETMTFLREKYYKTRKHKR